MDAGFFKHGRKLGRHRRLEGKGAFVVRMLQGHAGRVKKHPGKLPSLLDPFVESRHSVFVVACQWVTEGPHVTPNLVGATGSGLALDKRCVRATRKNPPVGQGVLELALMLAKSRKWRRHPTFAFSDAPLNERPVRLPHPSVGELLHQSGAGAASAGENDDAGRFSVEAVNGADGKALANRFLSELLAQKRLDRRVERAGAVHGNTAWLVDDDHRLVFMQERQDGFHRAAL